MCGILGALGSPAAHVSDAAGRLLAMLAHRGPDGHGVVRLDAAGRPLTPGERRPPHACLLHARLAILDPTTCAAQPMASLDGHGTLAFNGEIYDYREHRERLPHDVRERLPSSGDTAVLVELLRRDGAAILPRLTGMFAIAWVDAERGELLLARDRSGIKPLLYARVGGGIVFGSEIPPLLEVPGVSHHADLQQVHDFLGWNRNDGGSRTFFADIRQVPAGHLLRVPLADPGRISLEPFAAEPPPGPADRRSPADAAAMVREYFLDSIRLHLRSDVPVGCALSGGIDSSAIAAAIRHVAGPDAPVHAFTHVAGDPAICEERWADIVAAEAGITIHKVRATPGELIADLPALVRTQGEPFGSTSIYAQYRVFRAAREAGIPVMLDGQGADEMFAGYRHYAAGRIATLLGRGRLAAVAGHLAAADPTLGDDRGRLAARAAWLAARRFGLGRWPGLGRRPRLPAGHLDWFTDRGIAPAAADTLGRPGSDVMRSMLHDARTASSLPALLRFEDRNSMAHSVESRVPFLEPRLLQLAASLPESVLLGPDLQGKRVLREAMRGIVPEAILDRRDKIGFATPERSWLAGAADGFDRLLGGEVARGIPFLDADAARRRTGDALAGRIPFDRVIWRWISVVAWAEAFDVRWDPAPASAG